MAGWIWPTGIQFDTCALEILYNEMRLFKNALGLYLGTTITGIQFFLQL